MKTMCANRMPGRLFALIPLLFMAEFVHSDTPVGMHTSGTAQAGSSSLPPQTAELLDRLLSTIEAAGKGMGSVSIFSGGQEVYRRAVGMLSFDPPVPATPDSRYRIGSMTKMVTAVILLKQMERGQLGFDTLLSQYVPAIPDADRITMDMLLTHRSGIADFTSLPDYESWKTGATSLDDLLARIASMPRQFEPGSRFGYSNSNYLLLAAVAEQVGGSTYAELVADMVAGPLGLHGMYVDELVDPSEGEARSFLRAGGWKPERETHVSVTRGAGALTSTAADVNRFLRGVLVGDFLPVEMQERIRTFADGHSTGFQEFVFEGQTGIGHGGRVDGFQAYASHFEEADITITFLSNGLAIPLYDVWMMLVRIVNGLPVDMPVYPRPEVSALEAFAGTYECDTFPFPFNVLVENGYLILDGGGQKAELEYRGGNSFGISQIGLDLDFVPGENRMVFRQSGGEFYFIRK